MRGKKIRGGGFGEMWLGDVLSTASTGKKELGLVGLGSSHQACKLSKEAK